MLRVWWLALWFLIVACDASPAPGTPASPSQASSAAIATRSSQPTPPSRAGEGVAAGLQYLLRHTAGAAESDTLPLIVAIHGFGDDPLRFGLLDDYPARARVVLPRAPEPQGRGHAWFSISVRGERNVEHIGEGVQNASDQLARMIAALTKRYPTRGKALVTGFSQGGMLSFALAVLHPEQIALAVPVSGWLPAPLWPAKAAAGAPPIAALHGDADDVLAIAPTRAAVAALREAGFRAELIEYPGVPHTVSPAMQRELFRRLAEASQ